MIAEAQSLMEEDYYESVRDMLHFLRPSGLAVEALSNHDAHFSNK
jgi:hypothetical protein